jgi:hypothetical protein
VSVDEAILVGAFVLMVAGMMLVVSCLLPEDDPEK